MKGGLNTCLDDHGFFVELLLGGGEHLLLDLHTQHTYAMRRNGNEKRAQSANEWMAAKTKPRSKADHDRRNDASERASTKIDSRKQEERASRVKQGGT